VTVRGGFISGATVAIAWHAARGNVDRHEQTENYDARYERVVSDHPDGETVSGDAAFTAN
jgi:hypothetical protein